MYEAFVAVITVDELHLCASSLPKQFGITQGILLHERYRSGCAALVVGTGY